MDISERILKTISKIAKDENRRESSVTWNEIAIEQAIELNALFDLREVSQRSEQLNEGHKNSFKYWLEEKGYEERDGYYVNGKLAFEESELIARYNEEVMNI